MSNWAFQLLDSLGTNKQKVNSDGSAFMSGQPAAAGTAFDSATASKFMVVDENGNPMVFDFEGRVDTSRDSLTFYDPVDGGDSVPDRRMWSWAGTTMTVAQNSSPSRYTINAVPTNAINTNITLTSICQFVPYHESSIYMHVRCRPINALATNAQCEFGIGSVSGAGVPTDGAYFRWKASDGSFRCVVNFGGAEVESAAQTAPVNNEWSHMEIKANAENVTFEWESPYGTGLSYTVRPAQASASSVFNTIRQPIFMRVMIGASTPGAAPQIEFGEIAVYQKLLDFNESMAVVQVAALHNGVFQSPASTFQQTASYANSAAPTTVTAAQLLNTAAPAANAGKLGGKFAFIAPGPVETDFILFSYQNVVGKKLCITGITISNVNTVAAQGATTPLILDWGMACNATAETLGTTADTVPGTGVAFAIASRRISLGEQAYAVAAAIGAMPNPATIQESWFDAPFVVEPNRWWHLIVRVPVGPATGTAVIRGHVLVKGYYR